MTEKALIAAVAVALLASFATYDPAEARRSRGKDVIEKHYITDRPVRGFSGFAGGTTAITGAFRTANAQCLPMGARAAGS